MLQRLAVIFALAFALALPSLSATVGARQGAALAQTAAPPAAGGGLDAVVNALTFRNIGPFRTGGWVTAIAVPEKPAHDHLFTIYAASRSGGLWKTTNGATTWENISDSVDVGAVGAVAIAPSNPQIVWMGTGDQANARSSYSGKGVFKSTDAGKTWQFMGLPDSEHIARIVIHPANPDIVFVAAMGHLFSKNDERGVFRTLDGGKTWKKVLYTNDETGAIDLVINRQKPGTLYAAMYDKQRLPWRLIESGPETAVYRTDNGGDAWSRLGGGLPSGPLGRIGIDIYQKNPQILYALVENQNPPPAVPEGAAAPGRAAAAAGRGAGAGGAGRGAGRGNAAAADQPGGPRSTPIIGNEMYRTDDGGRTWKKTTDVNVAGGKAPYSFNEMAIDPNDDRHIIVNSDNMYESKDGGATWATGFFRGAFGDFRCMWWDSEDSLRIMLGSDGGVQMSNDGGRTVDYAPNIGLGESYAVGVDMEDPYNVYAGFQDHDSWKGPSNGQMGRITLENWVTVGPGDGMYNVVDPTDSRWVYNTRELNQMGRMDQKTGVRTPIAPRRTQGAPYRYNWIAPIAISPHNPQIVYAGAQVLLRSLDRGDHWEEISPDLTTNDASKIGWPSTPFCTITSISESPLKAGVIWVGTDDGRVHMTDDHGAHWTEATAAIAAAGGPVDRWVSRVFASPHDVNTAFVSKTGFRNDDFGPYLYRTTDAGKTWTAIAGNLPRAPINVVVQDRKNPHLLFVGDDLGVYVSIDDGASWTRLKANLPTVPVHDLLVHPRENDLVLATYGRALWVGDISPLQDLAPATLAEPVHLFDIEPRAHYGFSTQGMNYNLFGDKYRGAPNEPDGMAINYYLPSASSGTARITIADWQGKPVAELQGQTRAGLNRVLWNMQPSAPGGAGRGGRGGGGGGGAIGGAGGVLPAGNYLVTLEVAGQKITKLAQIRDRIWPGAR